MHITHVQGIFSPEHGGPVHSLRNYCYGQIRQGHRVSVRVAEGYANTSPAVRLELPVDMAVGKVGIPQRLGVSRELKKRLQADESPDIYHLHGTWLRVVYYGAAEAWRRRRPYLVELMGMYDPYGLQRRTILKWCVRQLFQDKVLHKASCLHVSSTSEANQLRRLGFQNPIAEIPVGVDIGEVLRQQAELVEFAVPWPELEHRPFVLYLARVHPKKGLELLLGAWSSVAQEFPDWRLLIAGSGTPEYVKHCQQLAKETGIENSCLWAGQVSGFAKSWAYTNAAFYVLPTYAENFGNSVAEALSHGTPVITTDTTPWTELPGAGCGWITHAAVEPLTEKLREALATDAATLKEMGQRGFDLVQRKYSLDCVLQALEATYLWILGRGEKPGCVRLN